MALAAFVFSTITAQNTFSNPIELTRGAILTLEGTWTATVSIQRKTASSGNWVDITNNSGTATTFTTNGTFTVSPVETAALYRFGVKTGNFTSGSIVGTLEGR